MHFVKLAWGQLTASDVSRTLESLVKTVLGVNLVAEFDILPDVGKLPFDFNTEDLKLVDQLEKKMELEQESSLPVDESYVDDQFTGGKLVPPSKQEVHSALEVSGILFDRDSHRSWPPDFLVMCCFDSTSDSPEIPRSQRLRPATALPNRDFCAKIHGGTRAPTAHGACSSTAACESPANAHVLIGRSSSRGGSSSTVTAPPKSTCGSAGLTCWRYELLNFHVMFECSVFLSIPIRKSALKDKLNKCDRLGSILGPTVIHHSAMSSEDTRVRIFTLEACPVDSGMKFLRQSGCINRMLFF